MAKLVSRRVPVGIQWQHSKECAGSNQVPGTSLPTTYRLVLVFVSICLKKNLNLNN